MSNTRIKDGNVASSLEEDHSGTTEMSHSALALGTWEKSTVVKVELSEDRADELVAERQTHKTAHVKIVSKDTLKSKLVYSDEKVKVSTLATKENFP